MYPDASRGYIPSRGIPPHPITVEKWWGGLAELREALALATAAGVGPDSTVIDPGFGFSKTAEQNLLLFDQLPALQVLGRPVLVGPSRKRFLGSVTGVGVEDRDRATATACAVACERGARLSGPRRRSAARRCVARGRNGRATSRSRSPYRTALAVIAW